MNFFVGVFSLFFVVTAQAGFISFSIQTDVQRIPSNLQQEFFVLKIKVRNQGDSPAHKVQPILLPTAEQILERSESGESPLEAQDILAQHEAEWVWKFSRPPRSSRFQWPVVENFFYRLDYQDANASTFSMPQFFEIPTGLSEYGQSEKGVTPREPQNRPFEVLSEKPRGASEVDGFLNESTVKWSFHNPNPRELRLKAILNLPRELELVSELPPFLIGADQTLEWSVVIRNKKGLAGSKYNLYLRLMSPADQGGSFDQIVSQNFKIGDPSGNSWGMEKFLNFGFLLRTIWIAYILIGGLQMYRRQREL